AIEHSRKALELAPGDKILESALIQNLCEAGRFEEGLQEYARATANGATSRWIHGGGALAHRGLERYAEAARLYELEPESNYRKFDLQRVRVLQGDLESAVAGIRDLLQPSKVETHQANEFLCGIYYLTDRPEPARAHVAQMADVEA